MRRLYKIVVSFFNKFCPVALALHVQVEHGDAFRIREKSCKLNQEGLTGTRLFLTSNSSRGDVAQLGERLNGIQEVVSSILSISTTNFRDLRDYRESLSFILLPVRLCRLSALSGFRISPRLRLSFPVS